LAVITKRGRKASTRLNMHGFANAWSFEVHRPPLT
jgi:hypothetical protein